jgi:UDP-3-O-[3-hydroxymyristoyl] N-acetylglucosamine deacetylase
VTIRSRAVRNRSNSGAELGPPLLGHVIAERTGHAMHVALVAKIMSDPSLYEILNFDQIAGRVAHTLIS